ncbi:PREDICTED: origin recognition complex subunit 1 isoform X2 [Ceratosolen solmsi marchali]|uniref:Origin recognition complex subunit 1 n=1 Tax=Ceratosolen solmsi marchali TaxID=326594 RepID=A0AAJ7E256_9HYME|nr:PREDICTED: origin recognition complex subunit 1 isoform X2 [Ceratosolen solmsi marchali]
MLTNLDHLQMKTRRSLHLNTSIADKKSSKDVMHNKKKLNTNDIIIDLESSDDEIIECSQKNVGRKNLRSTRVEGNANKIQRRHSNIDRTNVNYNIDYLWDKHEEECLKNINLESQSRRWKSSRSLLNRKETKEIKTNIRKRSVQATSKYEDLEESSEESENEIDENIMLNANTSLSPKRLKTRSANRISAKSPSQLRTPSKSNRKSLKESVDTPSREKLEWKTPSKSDIKSVKKCISTPTKRLSQLRTPSKSDKNVLTVSMNTPTRAFEDLKLNESSKPTLRRRTINIKLDTPSQNNSTLNKSASKVLQDDFEKLHKTNTRSRSAKFTMSYFSDSESEDKDDSDIYEVSDYDKDETSTDSEDDSSNEDLDSIKRQKFIKENAVTPNKRTKNVLKTPSKNLTKAAQLSLETPTKRLSRLSLKNSLSPSVHQRITNVSKPSTPLQEVRLKLHVSVLPKSLPCREEQFNEIYTYLHARLSDGSGGCIYISGVPGTGKTATVNEVIRCLKKAMNREKLSKFEFVDINGMKLSEPRQAYVQIWKQLTKQTVTWEAAQKLLQNRFTKPKTKRDMTLLLVDELDLLCTKRQDVVYNLLDWPSKSGAKLVVVTIANTMDLPERILMGRVTSRLGLTRLTFPPYTHKQLEEIVLCRLQGYDAFSGETVQLIARKVAAVSGDARRALDICRRSTEVAETNGHEIVSMVDVKKALDEMIASPKIQAIKHCSDMEKIFLRAVCAEVHRTGVEEVVFKYVYFQLQTLCTFDGEKAPNITEALSICARLGSWRLLLCDHSKMDIHQRLLLNVTTDDVHFAIEH